MLGGPRATLARNSAHHGPIGLCHEGVEELHIVLQVRHPRPKTTSLFSDLPSGWHPFLAGGGSREPFPLDNWATRKKLSQICPVDFHSGGWFATKNMGEWISWKAMGQKKRHRFFWLIKVDWVRLVGWARLLHQAWLFGDVAQI